MPDAVVSVCVRVTTEGRKDVISGVPLPEDASTTSIILAQLLLVSASTKHQLTYLLTYLLLVQTVRGFVVSFVGLG